MSDIVERLRDDAEKARQNWPEVFCVSEDLAEEAADEIEKLRAALRAIAEDCEADYPPSHGAIKYAARAALGEKK